MTDQQGVTGRRRRTPAEIERVVSEFASSGLNRSQFCRRQGLTLGTLNRYLQRGRGDATNGVVNGGLLPIEMKLGNDGEVGCGLAVLLVGGRRIEVRASFDASTLRRLVQVLEAI